MSPSRESQSPRVSAVRSTSLGAIVGDARLKDDFPKSLRVIAGVCISKNVSGTAVSASAVLMKFDSLEVLGTSTVAIEHLVGAPADNEISAIRDALLKLPEQAELVFVAGHGVADAARTGLAVQLGVLMNLATIGVALEANVGTSKPLHEMRGAFAPLRENRTQIGWILRSKINEVPLVVSPGHRVSMAAAPELVMAVVRGDRLPEPIRAAEALFQQD